MEEAGKIEIFIPEGVMAPSRDIIYQPELQVYVKNFGKRKGDICYVAEFCNQIVGAVWVRIMNDYGIGTQLMKTMIGKLKEQGYKQASLSVQKTNYAVHMYKKIGFEIVDENLEEYIMVCRL